MTARRNRTPETSIMLRHAQILGVPGGLAGVPARMNARCLCHRRSYSSSSRCGLVRSGFDGLVDLACEVSLETAVVSVVPENDLHRVLPYSRIRRHSGGLRHQHRRRREPGGQGNGRERVDGDPVSRSQPARDQGTPFGHAPTLDGADSSRRGRSSGGVRERGCVRLRPSPSHMLSITGNEELCGCG